MGRIVSSVVLVVALGIGSGVRAAEKVAVGIGGVALMVYLPTALAKAKGYFAEEGLDVEILDIKGGGSQAASALIGGSVDFSANAIDHAIKAKTQGKELRAVHSHVRLPVMAVVVSNKYKGVIKSIADLKGRPLGWEADRPGEPVRQPLRLEGAGTVGWSSAQEARGGGEGTWSGQPAKRREWVKAQSG
jgi:ABC-type nitrate/sulfonate/bicarbonate transport system substrate-binding protein